MPGTRSDHPGPDGQGQADVCPREAVRLGDRVADESVCSEEVDCVILVYVHSGKRFALLTARVHLLRISRAASV